MKQITVADAYNETAIVHSGVINMVASTTTSSV